MPQYNLRGLLDSAALQQKAHSGEIDTVIVAMPDMYGRLIGKRMPATFFVDEVAAHGMHACDYLLTSDMEMDPIPGYQLSSWGSGYGDFRCIPNLETLRVAAWLDRTALVMCDTYNEEEDKLVSVAPRSVLRQQIARAAQHGYTGMGAAEVEFYIFKDTYEGAHQKAYANLEPHGYYIEDYHLFQATREEYLVGAMRRHLENSGIPVESSKGEWGPGQHELNVRFSNLLEMSDWTAIYKHAAKEIAFQNKCAVTFMSKWDEKYAGSSQHVHLSLWDGDKPLFAGDEAYGPVHGSNIFRWFLGGWIKHVREISAFYAPYPTSWKRYQAASFAPTRVAISYDNRTTGFRIVGHGKSLRIECRMPGSDANPYLVFAASLAAGLDGVLNRIEPPAIFDGDAYAASQLPRLPYSLPEATAELERSTWAREALGDDVVDHYLHFFKTEQRKFDEVVTTWERARYFERA
jgi:glutamine synthetase